MPEADSVHSTPPINGGVMSKKGKKHKREQKSESSEIIRQCVIYVQSMAAYQAGFKVEIGNFDHAGTGKGQLGRDYLRTADHALARLISPSFVEGRAPLS